MKKQSLKDKMDEHLGAKHPGKKKQSMKSRRKESSAAEHAMGHFSAKAINSSMPPRKKK